MKGEWSFVGWCWRHNDTLSEPVPTEQIRQLVASGHLRPTDRVWESWQHGPENLMFPALASTAFQGASPLARTKK